MLSATSRLTRNLFSTAVLLALGSVAIPPHAMAQSAAAAIPEKVTLDIPAQPLKSALRVFAGATHLQLVYTSDLVAGLGSGGVSGSYAPAAALQQLLAGSGLVSRFTSPGVVTLEKLSADGTKVIGTVEVEGAKTAGANGSTDPTATEGTHSYTTNALTIGSKTAQSIREIPQSVSVITQQQMQDQNMTNVESALKQAAGITVITGNDGTPQFWSRGFQINTYQLDGGTPMNGGQGFSPTLPLALYDHIEVLRGSDGEFNGSGDPGGTVNLVRKRPLDHTQVTFEGSDGSWDNRRSMLDATGALPDTGGKVRTRLVIEDADQHYFYKTASNRHNTVGGAVEADLTPSTLVTAGGSYTKTDGLPWFGGLPRFASGADLGLPRDTCLCLPWSRLSSSSQEMYAKLQQRLGDHWTANFNVTDMRQMTDETFAAVEGRYIVPGNAEAGVVTGERIYLPVHQISADATLNGKFALFGHEHELIVGANLQNASTDGETIYQPKSSTYLTYAQLMNFDPAAYAQPIIMSPSQRWLSDVVQQYGFYSTLRLQLLDPLHLTLGVRDSGTSTNMDTLTYALGRTIETKYAYKRDNVLTPNYGLVYDLTKEWSVYASYTDIFKPQNYLDKSGAVLPPITGATEEVGLKAELLDRKLNLHLSMYRTTQQNAAVQDLSVQPTPSGVYPQCCYVAAASLLSQGVDAEISGQLAAGWQISASYTYNDSKFVLGTTAQLTGTALVSTAPKNHWKLSTTYQLPGALRQWTIGGSMTAQSSTFVSGSVCPQVNDATGSCKSATVPYSFTQEAYAVFNASVKYQIDKTWSAALNVDNIFDRTYYKTVGSVNFYNWYGAPRSFQLTMRGTW
jgi:outer membrane receptor for ferric coprogen and ferric-rhodotorulic acid